MAVHFCSACGMEHGEADYVEEPYVEPVIIEVPVEAPIDVDGSDIVAATAVEALRDVAVEALETVAEIHEQEEITEREEAEHDAEVDVIEAIADTVEEVADEPVEAEPDEEVPLADEPIDVAPPPREESVDVKNEGGSSKGRSESAFSRRHRR